MVYVVEDSILQWGIDADTPEEAHAKFKSIAAMLMSDCKKHPGHPNDPRVRKAVSDVMKGNFRVVTNPNLQEGWSDPPKWVHK